jgi:hypothetical protein
MCLNFNFNLNCTPLEWPYSYPRKNLMALQPKACRTQANAVLMARRRVGSICMKALGYLAATILVPTLALAPAPAPAPAPTPTRVWMFVLGMEWMVVERAVPT